MPRARRQQSIWTVLIVLGSLLLVAAIGFVDYATGKHLRIYPAYFVPVALAAQRTGLVGGVSLSLLSAMTWGYSNARAGMTVDTQFVWNLFVQLSSFLVVTALIIRLRVQVGRQRELARRDGLTGILNSRAFQDVGAAELESARRYGRPFALVYLDLDDFKTANDNLGHIKGDEILAALAAVLRNLGRASDIVARLGGDEFAVLLPETSREGAQAFVRKLEEAARNLFRESGWPVSLSIGVAIFSRPPASLDDAVRRADALMYQAKGAGKNRAVFSPEQ